MVFPRTGETVRDSSHPRVKRSRDSVPQPTTSQQGMTTRSGLALGSRAPAPKRSRPPVRCSLRLPVRVEHEDGSSAQSSDPASSLRLPRFSFLSDSGYISLNDVSTEQAPFISVPQILGPSMVLETPRTPTSNRRLPVATGVRRRRTATPNSVQDVIGSEYAEALAAQRAWEQRRNQIEQDERLARELLNEENAVIESTFQHSVMSCMGKDNRPLVPASTSFNEPCLICFAEPAKVPLKCKFCSQCVGCKECVKQWFGGPACAKNRKQCPLCRHDWKSLSPTYVLPINLS